MVFVSLFWISLTPSYPEDSMPSYHLGFSSLVLASSRTCELSVLTCSKHQACSANAQSKLLVLDARLCGFPSTHAELRLPVLCSPEGKITHDSPNKDYSNAFFLPYKKSKLCYSQKLGMRAECFPASQACLHPSPWFWSHFGPSYRAVFTWALAVVVSAMYAFGILPSFLRP